MKEILRKLMKEFPKDRRPNQKKDNSAETLHLYVPKKKPAQKMQNFLSFHCRQHPECSSYSFRQARGDVLPA